MSVTVTYTLYPPEGIAPSGGSGSTTPSSSTARYPITVSSSPTSTYLAYYSALSCTVLQAQKDLNESLTVWKDAVGDKEKHKEDPGKVAYGKGKAARMMQYAKNDGEAAGAGEVDEGDEDEED